MRRTRPLTPAPGSRAQGPPFNMKTLSVGTLGQMSGPELLQLLMDACIAVQPKLPRVVVAKARVACPRLGHVGSPRASSSADSPH